MKERELDVVRQPIEGIRLVEANAGTGKTYAIQHLFLRLLLEGAEPPGIKELLVVTFTEAAAAELRERIRANLVKAFAIAGGKEGMDSGGPDLAAILSRFAEGGVFDVQKLYRIKRAVLEFDEAAISTIHGFCSRTLSENAFESGIPFDSELSPDADAALEIFVKDFWRRASYPKARSLTASVLKAEGFGLEELLRFAKSIPDPDLRFAPASSSFDESRAQALIDELKASWPSASNEAAKLLLESKELSRAANAYRADKLDFHLSRMDRFAANRIPPPFDSFRFLSKSAVDEGVSPAKKAKGARGPEHPSFALCQKAVEAVSGCAAALKLQLAAELAEGRARSVKSRLGLMSFDDLLLELDRALRGPSGTALKAKLAARFKAVLIDEFQDTDPVQFRIFSSAFGGGSAPLFMIGDPKQSIYAFRRADVFSYEKVKAGHSSGPPLTLSRNFRSTKELVEAVNGVFALESPFRKPFVFDGGWLDYSPSETGGAKPPLKIDGEPALRPLRCVYLPADANGKPLPGGAAEDLALADSANRIAKLLLKASRGEALFDDGRGERPLEASDMAVLVDSNRNASRMKAELLARGVPAVLQKSSDVFKSEEAAELHRVLAAVADPRNPSKAKAALCSGLIALPPERLGAFAGADEGLDELKLWLGYFSELRSLWESSGVAGVLASLLDAKPKLFFDADERLPEEMRLSVKSRLLSKPGGERAVANLRQIAETLIAENASSKLEIEGQLSLLARLIAEEDAGEERECRLESDEDAVKIMTVHKSKGLQFPVVFAPLLWRRGVPEGGEDFRYHDADAELKLCLDPGAVPGALAAYQEETLAELVRLVYVALTRASRYCVFHFGQVNKAGKSALAYLFADPVLSKEGFLKSGALLPSKEELARRLGAAGAVEEPELSPPDGRPAGKRLDPDGFSAKVFENFRERVDNSRGTLSFSELSAHLPTPLDGGLEDEPGRSGEDLLPGFKPGALAGECIHKFLELFDLSLFDADPGAAESEGLSLASDCVASFGLAGRPGSPLFERRSEALPRQLLEMARRIAYLKLHDGASGFALAKVPKERTLRELEFDFAVKGRISEESLNALLEKEGFAGTRSLLGSEAVEAVLTKAPALGGSGGRRIAALRERSRRSGVMNGKADLVFETGGRFFIIDWKSNFLGSSPKLYSPTRLFADMLSKDYVLQYHIYSLALHLHLERTLEGYSSERSFGGVFYVYARGVGPESGIFYDRPSETLLEGLREVLAGGRTL